MVGRSGCFRTPDAIRTAAGITDLARNNRNNQLVPCMISSAGRYIWAENPFRFEMKNGDLIVYSDSEKLELYLPERL